MKKKLIFGIGAVCIIVGKLKIMGGINYFKDHEQIQLSDKTILITGGTEGIGWETAKKLSNAQKVIIAGRNFDKVKDKIKEYKNFTFIQLDLNDLENVNKFCQDLVSTQQKIDILINNAGIYNLDLKKTVQGFEQNFGVNYLSPFLLTFKLLECIPNNSESRIIFVSSRAHTRSPKDIDFNIFLNKYNIPYKVSSIYGISKLANIYQASSFAQYLNNTKIKVYCLHPGVVHTKMLEQFIPSQFLLPLFWYFMKTPAQGATTSTYLATYPNHLLKNGYYYKDCEPQFSMTDNNQLFNNTIQILKQMNYIK